MSHSTAQTERNEHRETISRSQASRNPAMRGGFRLGLLWLEQCYVAHSHGMICMHLLQGAFNNKCWRFVPDRMRRRARGDVIVVGSPGESSREQSAGWGRVMAGFPYRGQINHYYIQRLCGPSCLDLGYVDRVTGERFKCLMKSFHSLEFCTKHSTTFLNGMGQQATLRNLHNTDFPLQRPGIFIYTMHV